MNTLTKMIISVGKDLAQAAEEFYSRRPSSALQGELQRRTLRETADFVEASMPNALFCVDKFAHLEYVAKLSGQGLVMEFGVYKGYTINHLAKLLPHQTIYGFDSFRGLPDIWDGHRYSKKNFDQKGRKPNVLSNVELIEGWFDETVSLFVKEKKAQVAIAHIDCDIYSSTSTVLNALAPFITKGTLIIFDEFFNYPGYKNHEYKAFFEFIEKTGLEYDFVSFAGQQVCVRFTNIS